MSTHIVDAHGSPQVHSLTLSAEQLAELQRSWKEVVPVADEAVQLFYGRLFELGPELRQLFHDDARTQRAKFIEALAFIVDCANQPDHMLPMLIALGERHVRYGVRHDHYVKAGEALIWTLDEGLGLLQNSSAREAWVSTYSFVSTVMCAGSTNSSA